MMKPNSKSLPSFLAGALALAVGFFSARVFAAVAVEEPDVRRDATVLAIEHVMPSVVNIRTRTVVRGAFEAFAGLPGRASLSLGSGVMIDEAGYLLSNEHVVRGA